MSSLNNPYDAVDISAVQIEPMGIERGLYVFKVETSTHKPFDACVFRDFLVNFLFEHMQDDWHLGNDDRYIQFSEDDLTLVLTERDALRFRAYGWLI